VAVEGRWRRGWWLRGGGSGGGGGDGGGSGGGGRGDCGDNISKHIHTHLFTDLHTSYFSASLNITKFHHENFTNNFEVLTPLIKHLTLNVLITAHNQIHSAVKTCN
jgi:hypothetical protein